MLGTVNAICCRLLSFFQISFYQKIFQEHYQSVKQFGTKVGPDLGPNSLQRLSADDKSRCMLGNFNAFCCRLLTFFQIIFFYEKILSGTLSECQTVWSQIRTDVISVLILVENCLQRLSAEDESRCLLGNFNAFCCRLLRFFFSKLNC